MTQSRPAKDPFIQAVIDVLENIDLGGVSMLVGDGHAPDCDPPYLIVVDPNAQGEFTGPISQPEADADVRFQVVAVGEIPTQARKALDKARTELTRDNLQTALDALSAGRRVLRMWLEVSPGGRREDQGIPEPVFSSVDVYSALTTPQ